MKVLKNTDTNLKTKLDKLAKNNQSFSVIDGDTIHTFKAKSAGKETKEAMKARQDRNKELWKEQGLKPITIYVKDSDRDAVKRMDRRSDIPKDLKSTPGRKPKAGN